MLKIFKTLYADETGATAIEYALIAGIIAVSIIAGATSMGNSLGEIFNHLGETVESADPGA